MLFNDSTYASSQSNHSGRPHFFRLLVISREPPPLKLDFSLPRIAKSMEFCYFFDRRGTFCCRISLEMPLVRRNFSRSIPPFFHLFCRRVLTYCLFALLLCSAFPVSILPLRRSLVGSRPASGSGDFSRCWAPFGVPLVKVASNIQAYCCDFALLLFVIRLDDQVVDPTSS